MLVSASRARPPLIPPSGAGDAVRSVGILVVAGSLLVLATVALSGLIAPQRGGPVSVEPTHGPALELGAEPNQIGGLLVVSGERTGAMTVEMADSEPGYEATPEGGIAFARGEVVLSGPEGDIVLDPTSGEITRVEFDDLSFYLDPGDCTATQGGRSEQLGLMHLRVACAGIDDLRSGAVIGLEGVIAVPADALGDRGDLPPTGGTVEVGDTRLEIAQGVGIMDGLGPVDDPRVPLMVTVDGLTGLGILYDPAREEYVLNTLQIGGAFQELATECTLPAEGLGRLNPQTTVVRLTIDCADVPLPDGATGSVNGSIVVDLVDLVSDR